MKKIDAFLTKMIQAFHPTAIVYKSVTDQLKFVNYTIEMEDQLGGTHMVMLGENLSEAKRAAAVMVKAMRARSKRIAASAAALDPTCRVCGVLDCVIHKDWRFHKSEKHVCFWDPDMHASCPSCRAERA